MTTPTPYLDAARYRTRDDMLGGVRRQLRALPRYAAETAELDLADFADIVREAEDALSEHVVTLVQDQGWSWGQVAEQLGMSRQAAMRRWGQLVTTHRPRGGQSAARR